MLSLNGGDKGAYVQERRHTPRMWCKSRDMRTANLSVKGGGKTNLAPVQTEQLSRASAPFLNRDWIKLGTCSGWCSRVGDRRGRVTWSGTCVRSKWCQIFEVLISSQTPNTYERAQAHKSSGSRGRESDLFRSFCWR